MVITFVAYLLHYLPQILIVTPVLYYLFHNLTTERRWQVLMRPAVGFGLAMGCIFLIAGYPAAPFHDWSNCRLAPAIAWIKGYPLYGHPGEMPMLVQMYGPVSAMVYVISALADRPTTAVLLGAVINSLFYVLPAAWFLHRARGREPALFTWAALAIFLLFSGRQFILKEASTLVTIDAPAIGLAVCAMAMLARRGEGNIFGRGLLCGLVAGLSVWTKLTFAPIPAAMILYVLMTDGLRPTLRFAGGMFIGGVAITSLVFVAFGSALFVQNIVIPSRQHWQWQRLSPAEAYFHAIALMWRNSQPVGWMTLVGLILAVRWPGQTENRWRQWARQNPWLLPLMAALAIVPTAALAYVKFGGSWNNAVASCYLAFLAMLAALSGACASGADSPRLGAPTRLRRVAIVTLLLLGCWMGPASATALRDGLLAWKNIYNNPTEAAFEFARQHPGEIYLPNMPLATLMSEGKLYHFDAALESLQVAGFGLTEDQVRRYLPAEMRAIVYPQTSVVPPVLHQLREFSQHSRDPALPGWVVLVRPGEAP